MFFPCSVVNPDISEAFSLFYWLLLILFIITKLRSFMNFRRESFNQWLLMRFQFLLCNFCVLIVSPVHWFFITRLFFNGGCDVSNVKKLIMASCRKKIFSVKWCNVFYLITFYESAHEIIKISMADKLFGSLKQDCISHLIESQCR